MKKTVLLTFIFFFLSCSVASAWLSNRVLVKDRTDDPTARTGTGQYYSKSSIPCYIAPDGTVSILNAAGGGGSGGVSFYYTDDGVVELSGNTLFIRGTSGVSTAASAQGTSGDTIYIGVNSILKTLGESGNTAYGSGDSVYFVGGNIQGKFFFEEPTEPSDYSAGTPYAIATLRKTELGLMNNTCMRGYITDHEAQANSVVASVSGYYNDAPRVLNVNLGKNIYKAAWQNTTIAEGTDASPAVRYIYLQESGSTVVLTNSASSPDSQGIRHVEVGEMILGDVGAGGATIYIAHSADSYVDTFAHDIMLRFHEQGALYTEGFGITSNSSGVSIASGKYILGIREVECSGASTNPVNSNMANMGSSAAGMFFIKNDGTYSATTGFNFHGEYRDGAAIAVNKYYNINIGIVQSGLTTSGATPFRIHAMVQKGLSGEYGTFNAAHADEYGQEVSVPSVSFVKHSYVPIARLIAKAGVLQAFPDGSYHQDIRNRAAGGGAGQTAQPSVWTDDGTMLAPSTATRAVQVDSGITAGILYSGTSTYIGGTVNIPSVVSGNTNWEAVVTNADLQSQVSDYPYNSQVTSWTTDRFANIVTITDGSGPVFQFKPTTGDFWFTDSTGATRFIGHGSGLSGYFTAFNSDGGVINTADIADDAVTGAKIDYSSGVSIASAVTKVGTFSISNPQDYGGGSANSPFLIGHFPAEVYPDGVYIHSLKVRNTADGSQSSAVVFSEHNAGVSTSVIDTLTTSANTWVKDTSLLDAVIDGDNDLFAEALSGISGLAGTYIFYPR